VEFLTTLVGSEHTRGGRRKATREVGGISSQQLRYVDILLVKPWRIASLIQAIPIPEVSSNCRA
jgi:hypothetical protein